MNSFKKAMQTNLHSTKSNLTVTENSMPTYVSTLSPLLDLFYRIGNRNKSATSDNHYIAQIFDKAYAENPDLAIKIVGWSRSIRNGAGVKQYIRYLIEKGHINIEQIDWSWFGQEGYWKDLFYFTPDTVGDINGVLSTIKKALDKEDNLILKYFPRRKKGKPGHKNNQWIKLLKAFLELDDRNYRRMCASFRTPETLMCANNWEEIKYEQVPSVCMSRNRKNFSKHDKERFDKFIRLAKQVKPGEKPLIKTETLYPHEIIKPLVGENSRMWLNRYLTSDMADFAEAQWKSLPDKFKSDKKILVVGDTSGSMYDGTSIYISLALTIYCAERITGAFHNFACTFSSKPSFIEFLDTDSLVQKIMRIPEIVSNTNIEAVFDLILKKAVQENVPQNEMPELILIISDMQFDSCVDNRKSLAHEMMVRKFREAGYTAPNVIFWNVRNSSGVPVTMDQSGVALMSGASPNSIKQAIDGSVDPMSVLLRTVDKKEFNFLKEN